MMAGPFLSQSKIGDLSRELAKASSIRKREGLERHPTRAIVCGCPDPRCGGWHVIDTSRVILTDDDADAALRLHNQDRKKTKAAKRVKG